MSKRNPSGSQARILSGSQDMPSPVSLLCDICLSRLSATSPDTSGGFCAHSCLSDLCALHSFSLLKLSHPQHTHIHTVILCHDPKIVIKISGFGAKLCQFYLWETFLVVQWLRLHTTNAGDLGSIPGQRTRSHMPQLRPSAAKLILINCSSTV